MRPQQITVDRQHELLLGSSASQGGQNNKLPARSSRYLSTNSTKSTMEYVLAFLAGFFLNWFSLGAVLFFALLSEHYDASGWSVFWLLIAGLIAYFMFKVPLGLLLWSVPVYLGVGVLWSFYRYKRYMSTWVESLRDEETISRFSLSELHPTRMLDVITCWIINWPLSLLANLLKDVIDGVQTLVKRVFRGVYVKIYENAIKELQGRVQH